MRSLLRTPRGGGTANCLRHGPVRWMHRSAGSWRCRNVKSVDASGVGAAIDWGLGTMTQSTVRECFAAVESREPSGAARRPGLCAVPVPAPPRRGGGAAWPCRPRGGAAGGWRRSPRADTASANAFWSGCLTIGQHRTFGGLRSKEDGEAVATPFTHDSTRYNQRRLFANPVTNYDEWLGQENPQGTRALGHK